MSYTAAAALAAIGALALDVAVLRTRLLARRIWWVSYAIILFFQLVTNGVLAGRGIVRYDPATILGPRIAYAPVEDLLFGFALVLVTLSTWVWLGRRDSGLSALAGPAAGQAPPPPPGAAGPRRPAG